MKGSDVVTAARGWIDTPFLHQARERGAGVDCIGLVLGVAHELGIWPGHFDYRDYGPQPHNGLLLARMRQHCMEIPLEQASPGCVFLMRWWDEPHHVAIFADETIVHAAASFKRVVEQGYRGKWPKRTQHAFRLPGVSYV